LIGRTLCAASVKLGIPQDLGFDDLCARLISSAQGGKIDSRAYRAIWEARAVLAPRDKTAAS
jgi:hypothetical protein